MKKDVQDDDNSDDMAKKQAQEEDQGEQEGDGEQEERENEEGRPNTLGTQKKADKDLAGKIMDTAKRMNKLPVHSFAILPLQDGSVLMIPHDVTNNPIVCLLLDSTAANQLVNVVKNSPKQQEEEE